ncbi:MAG TPA: RNA polymerase sigma factor [Planctomycetota bacterium]|nr:RNA polymerase sigma factor [Planctomycetota bacterium]
MAGLLKLDDYKTATRAAEPCDLTEVVGRFQTPLLRYVGGILNRDEDAQDVVQEVFLCYCRFSQRGDAEAVRNLSSWLFSVAHNLSQDVLRKRQREKKAQTELAAAPAPAEADEGQAVDTIIRQAASERALAELRKLPEEYRQVLLLKIVQDMTLREIAKVTGLSFGNAAYRLNQGLKELARRLKEAGVL